MQMNYREVKTVIKRFIIDKSVLMDLSDKYCNKHHIKKTFIGLENVTKLQTLKVKFKTERCIEKFLPFLQKNRSITTLIIKSSIISLAAITKLVNIINNNNYNNTTQFTTIRFDKCVISNDAFVYLSEQIIGLKLQELYITRCKFDVTLIMMFALKFTELFRRLNNYRSNQYSDFLPYKQLSTVKRFILTPHRTITFRQDIQRTLQHISQLEISPDFEYLNIAGILLGKSFDNPDHMIGITDEMEKLPLEYDVDDFTFETVDQILSKHYYNEQMKVYYSEYEQYLKDRITYLPIYRFNQLANQICIQEMNDVLLHLLHDDQINNEIDVDDVVDDEVVEPHDFDKYPDVYNLLSHHTTMYLPNEQFLVNRSNLSIIC
jgi:hypothetical protein